MKRDEHPVGYKILRGRRITWLRVLRLVIYVVIIAVAMQCLKNLLA